MSDNLWRRLKSLRQEVLNLKQIKKVSSAAAYYEYVIPYTQDYHSDWLITYKAGTQPIITEVLSDAQTSLSTPSGDKQYIFAYSHMTSTIRLLSTREIESVVGL